MHMEVPGSIPGGGGRFDQEWKGREREGKLANGREEDRSELGKDVRTS